MRNEPLEGWKAIAAHLRVSVRTAQYLEKKQELPIFRCGGEGGQVSAWPADLEAWQAAGRKWSLPPPGPEGPAQAKAVARTESANPGSSIPPQGLPRRRRAAGWLAALAAGGALLALTVWLASGKTGRTPAGFDVAGSDLVTFDQHGKELWRYAFEQPLFIAGYKNETAQPRMVWFANLDGSGHTDTLFIYMPADWQARGKAVYCFSDTGRLKWRFVPGRRVSDKTHSFEPVFFASDVLILPRTRLGGPWVVISSIHEADYPGQIAVLSPGGRLLSEYWHSGHVPHLLAADIDGDGVPEVLAAGVNNGYQRATLIALDPRRVYGTSRQPEGDFRQLQGMDVGAEKAVILFPKTCVSEGIEEYNRVVSLRQVGDTLEAYVMEAASERHHAQPYLIYLFDRGLKLLGVTHSDQFVSWHKSLEAEGKLTHAFDESEMLPLHKLLRLVR